MSSTQKRQQLARQKKAQQKYHEEVIRRTVVPNTTTWVDEQYGQLLANQLFHKLRVSAEETFKRTTSCLSLIAMTKRPGFLGLEKSGNKVRVWCLDYIHPDITANTKSILGSLTDIDGMNDKLMVTRNEYKVLEDGRSIPIPLAIDEVYGGIAKTWSKGTFCVSRHSLGRLYERLRTNSFTDVYDVLFKLTEKVFEYLCSSGNVPEDGETLEFPIGDGTCIVKCNRTLYTLVFVTYIPNKK